MKKTIFLFAVLTGTLTNTYAQNKKDGTPDMRYSANKQTYTTSYYNNETNTDVRYQSGYTKGNGTYVEPHYKTNNNNTNWDNYSTKDNYNYTNGSRGTRARDYSNDALDYGSGYIIQTGPKGGQYYINNEGNKIYVPKR